MCIAIAIATNNLFGLYLRDGLLGNFPQPTLILFKINVFVAGMAVAFAYLSNNNRQRIIWFILCASSLLTSAIQIKIMALFIVLMFFSDREDKWHLKNIGSGKLSKFFADTSYSVYLSHLLILVPAQYFLFRYDWYVNMSQLAKFITSLFGVGILVYGISFLLFHIVELPGITFGKKVLRLRRTRVFGDHSTG